MPSAQPHLHSAAEGGALQGAPLPAVRLIPLLLILAPWGCGPTVVLVKCPRPPEAVPVARARRGKPPAAGEPGICGLVLEDGRSEEGAPTKVWFTADAEKLHVDADCPTPAGKPPAPDENIALHFPNVGGRPFLRVGAPRPPPPGVIAAEAGAFSGGGTWCGRTPRGWQGGCTLNYRLIAPFTPSEDNPGIAVPFNLERTPGPRWWVPPKNGEARCGYLLLNGPEDFDVPWIDPGDDLPGLNVLRVHLVNRAARSRRIAVALSAGGMEMRTLTLPSGVQTTVHVPYRLAHGKAAQRLSLSVAVNDRMAFTVTERRTPFQPEGVRSVEGIGVFHLELDRDLVTGDEPVVVRTRGVFTRVPPWRDIDLSWGRGVRLVDGEGRDVPASLAVITRSRTAVTFRNRYPLSLGPEVPDGIYLVVMAAPDGTGCTLIRRPLVVARKWAERIAAERTARPRMPETWRRKLVRIRAWAKGCRRDEKFRADLALAELGRNARAAPDGPFTGTWDYTTREGEKAFRYTAFVPSTHARRIEGLPMIVAVHEPDGIERRDGLWGLGDALCAAAERHKAVVVRVPAQAAAAGRILKAAMARFRPDRRRVHLVAPGGSHAGRFAIEWGGGRKVFRTIVTARLLPVPALLRGAPVRCVGGPFDDRTLGGLFSPARRPPRG